jgi:predicted dehydrogenase
VKPFEEHNHYKIWEPLLADMSIHHFDLMRMVLGQEPQEVICKTWNPTGSKYVEAAAGAAMITFDHGTVVSYRGNWVSSGTPTNWAGEWHMECEEGEIVWTSRGEFPESVVVRPHGKPEEILELPDEAEKDRAGSLAAFVEAVQTGNEPECSGKRNLNTLALMFATIEAAASGQPMTIPVN